jgi:hypothetical protein
VCQRASYCVTAARTSAQIYSELSSQLASEVISSVSDLSMSHALKEK